jgi:hypothetical protein
LRELAANLRKTEANLEAIAGALAAGIPQPPQPPPPPQPPEPPANPHKFAIRDCTLVFGDDIRDWPATSEITRVALGRGELCTEHTKYGKWPNHNIDVFPPGNPVWGNQWIFARMNGKWYMGVGHWMRDSQQSKGMDPAENIGGPQGLFYRPDMEPLFHWRPAAGEVFGVCVSTLARVGQSAKTPAPHERSKVVLVAFPAAGSGGDLRPVWTESVEATPTPGHRPATPVRPESID